MSLEQEIIETVGFEPRRNYKDRQDYLAALARAVDQASNEDFDQLSKEATDWFNSAVQAINKKEQLPEVEETEEDESSAPESEEEVEPAEVDEAPVVTKPKKKGPKAAEVAQPEEVEATPKRRRKGQAPVKKDHPEVRLPAPGEAIEMDEFGVVKGSKNAAAVAMLAQGCRMADVTESLGGTYYNLVQRLVKQGHKLEKGANGMIKIIHRDGTGKKAKK